jgi:redox-sensitive bicupin YhaK (pirin superfamily)
MKRKDFLKNSLLGLGVLGSSKLISESIPNQNDVSNDHHSHPSSEIMGFNHLPPQQHTTNGNMIIHKADSRGHANHGWLDSKFTFSFASYYNPSRMHFGALRVLNDDIIGEGMGFGMHPHDNMEIISVPISGSLEHKDNMGNHYVIQDTEIQVMSAGSGIYHSEYNPSSNTKAQFLQIWVFTNQKNAKPRYGQMKFDPIKRKNTFQLIVSPDSSTKDHLWIHQNAWFSLSDLDKNKEITYPLYNKNNGVYVFIIDGSISVNGQILGKRDGAGITDTDSFTIKAHQNSSILLMEVPMKW